MNVRKIKELSDHCEALVRFQTRCTWTDAVLSVSGHILTPGTSALVRNEIGKTIGKQIEALKAEIKEEAAI